MDSLIQVQADDAGLPTVDARTLHENLGVGRDFTTWIRGRIDQYGFREERDFTVISRSPDPGTGNRGAATDYALSLPMAKELAMVENNERGREVRRYLIRVEEAWNSDDMVMGRALKILDRKVKTLQAKAEEDRPKVEFYDQYAEAGGSESLQNAARILGQPPNKWIKRLQHDGFLFKRSNRQALVPYAPHLEAGIFEVRTWTVNEVERMQTRVTPKGIQFFARKLHVAIPESQRLN